MPRPVKCRSVCCLPLCDRFGPKDDKYSDECITMTLDEYETIRLIDYVGLTQEECGDQMDIARTTVQGIYEVARKKLSDFLVNGKNLYIKGGNYRISDKNTKLCKKKRCKNQCKHNND